MAISSLLWLPHLNAMRMPGRKIGIITFDSSKLTTEHLLAAWPSLDQAAIAVVGMDGTRTWKDAGLREAVYDFDQIWCDLSLAAERLVRQEPSLQIILLECVTLCPFVSLLKQQVGLPVFDIVSMTKCWLRSLSCDGLH